MSIEKSYSPAWGAKILAAVDELVCARREAGERDEETRARAEKQIRVVTERLIEYLQRRIDGNRLPRDVELPDGRRIRVRTKRVLEDMNSLEERSLIQYCLATGRLAEARTLRDQRGATKERQKRRDKVRREILQDHPHELPEPVKATARFRVEIHDALPKPSATQ